MTRTSTTFSEVEVTSTTTQTGGTTTITSTSTIYVDSVTAVIERRANSRRIRAVSEPTSSFSPPFSSLSSSPFQSQNFIRQERRALSARQAGVTSTFTQSEWFWVTRVETATTTIRATTTSLITHTTSTVVWDTYVINPEFTDYEFAVTTVRGEDPSLASLDNGDSNSGEAGLSAGAKAGIGVGVVAGVAGIAGLLFLFVWRRRKNKATASTAPPVVTGIGAAAAGSGNGVSSNGETSHKPAPSVSNNPVSSSPPPMSQQHTGAGSEFSQHYPHASWGDNNVPGTAATAGTSYYNATTSPYHQQHRDSMATSFGPTSGSVGLPISPGPPTSSTPSSPPPAGNTFYTSSLKPDHAPVSAAPMFGTAYAADPAVSSSQLPGATSLAAGVDVYYDGSPHGNNTNVQPATDTTVGRGAAHMPQAVEIGTEHMQWASGPAHEHAYEMPTAEQQQYEYQHAGYNAVSGITTGDNTHNSQQQQQQQQQYQGWEYGGTR